MATSSAAKPNALQILDSWKAPVMPANAPGIVSHSTRFKKGMTPWNKGTKCPDISEKLKGRKVSDDMKNKISKTLKKKHVDKSIKSWNTGLTADKDSRITRPWLGKKRPSPTFESRMKVSIALSGNKSPYWKGGKSSISKIVRRSFEYRFWRTSVFKRDNWTCQICKKRGGSLEAHHIKSFSSHPDIRFEIYNGQTLCQNCHRKTENWGRKQTLISSQLTFTK